MSRRRGSWEVLPQQHRRILHLLRSGYGICKTAAIVGVGVRTVQRRVEIIRTTGLVDGEIDYHRLSKPMRCEVHGAVSVWPCVACAAIASIERSTTLAEENGKGV